MIGGIEKRRSEVLEIPLHDLYFQHTPKKKTRGHDVLWGHHHLKILVMMLVIIIHKTKIIIIRGGGEKKVRRGEY